MRLLTSGLGVCCERRCYTYYIFREALRLYNRSNFPRQFRHKGIQQLTAGLYWNSAWVRVYYFRSLLSRYILVHIFFFFVVLFGVCSLIIRSRISWNFWGAIMLFSLCINHKRENYLFNINIETNIWFITRSADKTEILLSICVNRVNRV